MGRRSVSWNTGNIFGFLDRFNAGVRTKFCEYIPHPGNQVKLLHQPNFRGKGYA